MTTKIKIMGSSREEDLPTFQSQVTEFLDAVVHRRKEPFYAHLSREFFTIAILPGDNVIDEYDEYVKFHEKWLSNSTGKWTYRFEHLVLHSKTLATAVVLSRYEDQFSGEVSIREIRIKDLFTKQNGIWYLTESQNTTISDRGIE